MSYSISTSTLIQARASAAVFAGSPASKTTGAGPGNSVIEISAGMETQSGDFHHDKVAFGPLKQGGVQLW